MSNKIKKCVVANSLAVYDQLQGLWSNRIAEEGGTRESIVKNSWF